MSVCVVNAFILSSNPLVTSSLPSILGIPRPTGEVPAVLSKPLHALILLSLESIYSRGSKRWRCHNQVNTRRMAWSSETSGRCRNMSMFSNGIHSEFSGLRLFLFLFTHLPPLYSPISLLCTPTHFLSPLLVYRGKNDARLKMKNCTPPIIKPYVFHKHLVCLP